MIALGGAYSHVFVSMLILGVLCAVISPALAGTMYTFTVKYNSSYAVLIAVEGTPLSFVKGNVSVRRGSPSDPCVAGQSCWELLSDRLYAQLNSDKVSGNGTIILTPSDRKKSPTEILVRDLNETSKGLPRSKGIGQTEVLQLDPQTNSVTFLIYNETVQDTIVNGNIQIRDGVTSGVRWLMVPYLTTFYKGKNAVLITGYIGTSGYMLEGKLAGNGTIQIVIVGNSNVPDYKTLRVSFRSACAVNTWNIMLYVLALIIIKENA
nr:unnamed protein product [Spirometra erinaceieuropaei]